MKHALYFPYISIPETPWLIQALLYWDKVASIAPQEIHRDKLEPHMKQLLDNNLVSFINPSHYICRINEFENVFINFLDSLPNFNKILITGIHSEKTSKCSLDPYVPIHIEKLFSIASVLVDKGLAYPGEDNWYYVEKQIANYFMTYLAVGISSIENYQPVSDRYRGLSAFGGVTFRGYPPLRSRLRARVLEEILPTPNRIDNYNDILSFKEKYEKQLKGFRGQIERFLISIDHLPYKEAYIMIEDFINEISEEKDELAKRMNENGFPNVTFNTVCAVGSVGLSIADGMLNKNPCSLAAGAFGLAQLWSTLKKEHAQNMSHPMAYAVYVNKKFNSL